MQSEVNLSRKSSVKSVAARHDGHTDGNLNCVALRHGWRRQFSIPPEGINGVETLSYSTLETILELHTLRLRPMQLRIFVENPPESGTFSKVRAWKDDGSLQSVLVKQFFTERMQNGVVTVLEVRDGHDREDAMSVKSLAVGGGSRIASTSRQTTAWLKQHGIPRKRGVPKREGTGDEEEEDEAAAAAPSASRFGAFMYAFGLSSEPPAPPPKTAEQIAEERQQEEQVLKKSGWMPPIIRRMTSRRSARGGNPFFGGSERGSLLTRSRSRVGQDDSAPTHLGEEHDAQELGVIDDEDMADAVNNPTPNARPARWLRFLGGSDKANGHAENAENPFEDGNELAKVDTNGSAANDGDKKKELKRGRKNKGKGKANELGGAKVIKEPSEAFQNGPKES